MAKRSKTSGQDGQRAAFPVVGIGASAGGLEALRLLFRDMPVDTDAAFVLVQHLDPTHESLMAGLLAKYTDIPVVQVTDGMRVEPNRIHVIPPNSALTIADAVLHLSEPTARRGLRMPIDQFFISLAEDQQDRAIAIVLTGTGTDGTSGVGMIKARGGMLMAQDPATAAYDGMPRSAVATGHVDYVLPVEEMPDVLVHYLRHLESRNEALAADKQDDDYFNNILALIRARQDYDFRCYKRGTLQRRILRRMGLAHVARLQDYHARLRTDDKEVQALAKDLLIGVTGFFREPEAWDALAGKVLPELIARRGNDDPIRIWVPGCATGEEAYSVAMVALEALEQSGGGHHQLVVFATDLDKTALEVARAGIYPESVVAPVAPERVARFFTREGDRFQVKKSLREKVIVAPQNLVTDPPFSNIDLISCRNLLIYLEPDCQERLMVLFHFALSHGGFLLLGNSETVGPGQGLFTPVVKKWRIYRRADEAVVPTLEFPLPGGHRQRGSNAPAAGRPRRRVRGFGPLTQRALLEHFSPAAVLVDREDRVLYYHGSVRDYLGPTAGDPSEDVLSLAPEGLRGKLRTLLREAAAGGKPVSAGGAHVRRGEHWYTVSVTVTPVRDEDNQADIQGPLLLVTLQDEHKSPPAEGTTIDQDQHHDATYSMLEGELRATREELRGTIEQMETSNEELKASNEEVMSMNEELQSTNEELETSKEELQSLNEELTTLNSQLEDKVHELEDINNDLGNLLVSTDIATLFLDRRFYIRRYTPAATRLFSLIPSDIGRAMTDITRRFDDDRLLEDARKVLAGIAVEQHELCAADGRWYLRRLLPYRTEDEPVSGVVVTFTEITDRKRAELALAESERTLRRVTDAMPALISYIDRDERYRFVNAAYGRWFQRHGDDLCGTRISEVVGAEAYAVIGPRLKQALAGQSVEYDAWIDYGDAGRRYVHAEYIPHQRADGQVAGTFVLVSDITDRRHAEEAIERLNAENQARLDEMEALFDAAPIGIFVGRDAACRNMAMNRAGARMLRLDEGVNPSLSGPDAPALPFRVFHDGRELTPDELPMQVAARQGRHIDGFEEELLFADGERRTLMTYAAPLRNATGGIRGCVGTFADITAAREADRRHRETLERLNLHLDNSPVAAMEWDADGYILRWSPAAERIFGWTEAEVLGQSVDALGCVHDDDCEAVHTAMAALVNGDVERNRLLNRNLRKNGEVIWCEWYNSVLRDAGGVLVSVLSLAMDVTDRQKLEADLRLQAERLAEADRRKDEFLSMLGHELRNPLAPIRNALSVLAMVGDDKTRTEWAHRLIDRQTGHLERLVDDLLDTARITRGAVALRTEVVDLRCAVREAVDATRGIVAGRGHRLELELPEATAPVIGDITRLVQVITNLINNAAKYTDDGGTIRVSLTRDDTTTRLTVADNGRGISAGDLPHIFEVFRQGRQALDRADGGLGLGLPLVGKLVKMHGGTVDAESAGAGQGSRFIVTLPLSAEGVPEISEPPRAARSNSLKRIILADDNPDVLDSLKFFLQVLGHQVWDLARGGPVPALVEEVKPDVVILDIGLPDIDGIEVARRLCKLPHRSAMKVIALSGYVEYEPDEHLFDAHLLKGSNPEELIPFLD
jgi:PAS domain S-box-containing protein